ncbi:MAG: hypothetical protein HOG03_08800 [Desulfobacula sp.]|jgi:hypothetical protein|uniref:hypothetical protein n=1 Tax=Desulfobacula sp. TaxID=2593537 RepID=UPI001DE52B17|nr:hypothetical protein [Desulfobacula sp.]MBT3484843.1 hypothetical protein [Desulfobacula sp.]MBT3804687.1 hypothetical protein [Desulfobacula sp.]MBT4024037.1 hypothetical protein [Desulfobacula sp.]MBT4198399.1 hypothetical protein [Desulfobacula sp.]
MGKKCNVYTSEDISRFVDKELPKNTYHEVKQHLNICLKCNQKAEEYRTLSSVFTDHAHQEILKIDPAELRHKLAQTQENLEKKSLRNVFGIFGKNIYLKLASIAAILIISLYTFQGDHPAGPSAIVKSIDTDFASVVIIETQKENHTIIWFSET